MKKRFKESQDITINGNQNNLGWGETWDKKIQQEYEMKQLRAQQQIMAARQQANKNNKNRKRSSGLGAARISRNHNMALSSGDDEDDNDRGDDESYNPKRYSV